MSSNIKVQRICQHCSNEFTARTTVTRFCSHTCARQAYKKREKVTKTAKSDSETLTTYTKPLEVVKSKEFLTVREVAQLLNCSIRSAYYFIENGTINAVNLGKRITRVRRSEIDNLFKKNTSTTPLPQLQQIDITNSYTIAEVQKQLGISEKGLYSLIERNKIPKVKHGKFVYVSKSLIDNLLT
jgi:excisionase family DNA binding protein